MREALIEFIFRMNDSHEFLKKIIVVDGNIGLNRV